MVRSWYSRAVEPYQLRRGAFKNLTLRLTPEGHVKVSAPWFLPQSQIDRFVQDRQAWIDDRRRSLNPGTEGGLSQTFAWGRPVVLRFENPAVRPQVVWVPGDPEAVFRVSRDWDEVRRRQCVDEWHNQLAAEALETLVPQWEARTGLRVEGWRVKTLKSRWGSCRPDRRTLVFNGRLAAFPPECLEHVVVHEFAHLRIPHHGPAFHSLVESWLPGAREVNRLLRAGPSAAVSPGASPETAATPMEETGR